MPCSIIAAAWSNRNRVGQFHQPVGVDQPRLGIAADRPRIGDPVAGRDTGDALADRLDDAGALDARA